MTHSPIESVCVFGSVARARTDRLSDKDVLIVADQVHRRSELKRSWEAEGWSVSVYTPSRLEAIIKAGSLFAQHLKHEGIIVSDLEGWLSRRLQRAAMKKCYLHDARMSVELALPIERFNSDLHLQTCPIVADLAFVSVRNFGVSLLANSGRLVFDYERIVCDAGSLVGLSDREMKLLLSLRFGKVKYRYSGMSGRIEGTVGELQRVISKLFPHRPISPIQPNAPLRDFVSGYARLRDLEAAVLATLGGYPTSTQLRALNLERIWSWVISPKDYAWNIRNKFLDFNMVDFEEVVADFSVPRNLFDFQRCPSKILLP